MVELAVLRDLLVFAELGRPGLLRDRRQHARDRLPFDDGQPRLRQPRRAADRERDDHQRGHDIEPEPDKGTTGSGGVRFGHLK